MYLQINISMNLNRLPALFILLLFSACNHQQEKSKQHTFGPKVVEAKGYVVPLNDLAPPVVELINESKLKRVAAGIPKGVATSTNVHLIGYPTVDAAVASAVYTPGHDSILAPVVINAVDSPFAAGIPQIVTAKDAAIKDQNPENFSSFGKLQGLKGSAVRCQLRDRSGNLWFGTDGGVSKYDGKSFTHFTEKEGLSNNVVWSILEDKNGNLWFGTFSGVSKYDGKSFTRFAGKEGLASGVCSIVEDKNGNFWFGTAGSGAVKYDGKTFTQFTRQQGLSNNYVSCVLEDKKGNLWFGTNGGGVSKYDGKAFIHFTEDEGLSNNFVSTIYEDKNGNIWFGTYGGASKYDGKAFTQFTEEEGLSNDNVLSILEDKSGNLWFGTNSGGVSKYDGKSFTHYTEKEGLIQNTVWSILEDASRNLWFGTGGGVSKFNGKTFTHFTEKEGLGNNVVWGILKDKYDNLWFGTDGGGVSKYDGKSFLRYTEKEGLSDNVVFTILQDKNENIWFGTAGSGVARFDGRSFTHFTKIDGLGNNYVHSILQDRSGNIWFGTGEGVAKYDGKSFTRFSKKQGLTDNSVLSMIEDKTGNIWFGTDGDGAIKYDGKNFVRFTDKEGLSNNTVLCMLEDKSGNIWFGTEGGGVCKYDEKTFTHFTEKEGLSNDGVCSILQDKSGTLWFGTRFGLGALTPSKFAEVSEKIESNTVNEGDVFFKSYTYEDGFSGNGCNDHSICEAANGTIWIGADNRLSAYHPEGDLPDTIAPNIQLTSLELYSENISWQNLLSGGRARDTSILLGNGVSIGSFEFDDVSKWYGLPQHLSLNYNNNYLTFNFIGITQKGPKKVRYKYKLEGIDDNWSALSDRTEAPYGNLPNGTYTFKVKAMNGEGYWSNEFDYTFTIRPPWWKTWWFRSLAALLVVSLIFLYIKWRERSLRETQKILERTVDERTAEVVAEKKEVEKQKERSEELLLNILPAEVAEELKAKGSAEAQLIDEVTVLFADFKGFTFISEKFAPKQLVAEINECFSAFDHIMHKHGVEKIKTIGDSYMAAGGIPRPNTTHATDVVKAALEMLAFMQEHKARKEAAGELFFEIRIGVHTGPVVAGIVGIKKFAYDIWGDAVNTASRMESSGEPGKINISGATYELVKNKFRCTYRGKIEAKNKGMIDMYFVEPS
ncbi:MAG: adenylate/guanylate cyclase [Bacteroidota bacterium]|nr:adenylate/guanylate cyclase [Bacteroidota bacterium]